MGSPLHDVLERDHERLDRLLADSLRADGSVDMDAYSEFRRGLLWHIGVEEKLLFPAIRKDREEPEVVRQLHRDHAALSVLLVVPPQAAEIAQIREILNAHNPLEESEGGMYDIVEQITGDGLSSLIAAIRAFPPVRVLPHADTPFVRKTIEQLVRAAAEGRKRLLLTMAILFLAVAGVQAKDNY
jgi:hemerythrin HHE cation binding domain-containing protein